MGTSAALLVLAGLLAVVRVKGSNEPWLNIEKHAERGSTVELPCQLKQSVCGGLHSIKWYRGASRLFIYSEGVGLTRGTDDIEDRLNLTYVTNATKNSLVIPRLKLEDEGLYKCEATYLAVNRECNNVQHITLTVTVKPDKLTVKNDKTGDTIEDGTTLVPVNEGTRLVLDCESGSGKPVPVIEWWNGTQLMKAENFSTVSEDGTGVGKSRLEVVVSRGDLGAQFTCQASSPALQEPLKVKTNVIVNVRPLEMTLKGVVGHVVNGSKVLLQCLVKGARPAANVTWFNGTDVISTETGSRIISSEPKEQVDGTYETESSLGFDATQYENGKTFSCHAENVVIRDESDKPMKRHLTIDVYYPPIVTVRPENITVNESLKIRLFCEYTSNPAKLLKVKWLRDGVEVNLSDDRFEGGIPDQTTLVIRNSTPSDMGTYTCVLANDVGESTSSNSIDVSVLYRPVVEVSMDPPTPVNEMDRLNVSLTCNVYSGNPTVLTAVRWYLDGDLLKELPDCVSNSTPATIDESSTFCDIDPSKLLLEVVGRSFHGNYSCEGRNEAGWGPISGSTPVIVHYKPGPASIAYEPQQVVKKGRLKITCSVVDVGRPEVMGYKWFRGQHRLTDENKSVLVIESANLETQANFTCLAYNAAGDGDPATVFVEVSAPPAFIKKLHPYNGTVYNTPNASIECSVECVPLCHISWIKDDIPMNFENNNHYYVSNTIRPPDPETNDFKSIRSELIWNMTSWPNGELDRFADNGKFTCESSGNSIGPGVKSTTHFHVEFPPENITVSNRVVNVTIDHIPERVLCSAKAHPEPGFKWYREGVALPIIEGNALVFDLPIAKRSTGNYICEAKNRHGSQNMTIFINVEFKPTCTIEKESINGEDYLVCSAEANPKEVDFSWSLKNENDTLEQIPEERDGKSYILLDRTVSTYRTYVCVANNTIGSSNPCESNIPGNRPWWMKFEGDLLLILIIVAVVIILIIIIICIVLFLICRRKRNQAKHPTQAANNNHVDSVSEGLPEPETKTFYENLPFHGIQTPPNKTANIYNYQEHYQQHQQELQQYGYPVASSSSNQLTLPLTRSLHHSVASPSPMLTTTNSSNAVHLNHRHSLPRALVHGDMEMDLVHDHQPRGGSSGRRHERRKYRKHGTNGKQKQQRRQDPRRTEPAFTFSRETSFNEIQEPRETTYKISYPHYYEDSITECPLDYPSFEGVPRDAREHREREVVDRYQNSNSSSLRYTDLQANSSGRGRSKNNKTNNKSNKNKRHANSGRDPQTRSPSAPPASQYPELHFRDVGQEIDV